MRYEVPILVAEGDKVAACIRVFFRKRSNERMVQFDIAAFYSFRDGRIAQIREIIDTFDLVQQVLERDVSAVLTGKQARTISRSMRAHIFSCPPREPFVAAASRPHPRDPLRTLAN